MKLTNNLYMYPEKGMLDANTYVIKDKTTVLFDPGMTDFLPYKLKDMKADGIDPQSIKCIFNTHLHLDHYCANEPLKKITGARILIHPLQKAHRKETIVLVSQFFGVPEVEFTEDEIIQGDTLNTGDMHFDLIPSPGHSPDNICFYERQSKILICADVLFDQNAGRTDLPGGSAEELKQSIERLSQLDVEYLLPGHMGIVSGREKVKQNFEFLKRFVVDYL
jgi:hydroxyacylglutathione hydrolase